MAKTESMAKTELLHTPFNLRSTERSSKESQFIPLPSTGGSVSRSPSGTWPRSGE